MVIKRSYLCVAFFFMFFFAVSFRSVLRGPLVSVINSIRGRKTVEDRLAQYGDLARSRLSSEFERLGVTYPPDRITLVGIKQDKILEVWVSEPPKLLISYPVLAASGGPGPKLREGDRQVPEGLYRIESLNPNSMYHLSLRLNYPNDFDLKMAARDGREHPGSDIMIHGKNVSIGCLAIGDDAVEDLFVLAAETGIENISVILTPVDFRTGTLPLNMPDLPDWAPELYASIEYELLKLRQADD